MSQQPTNLLYLFLASAPILTLLFTMIYLKWKSKLAGIVSWFLAALLAFYFFGITGQGFLVACGKGLTLSIFVLLIIWSAVILYNLVDQVGALKIISKYMVSFNKDRLLQVLLMSWCFASFIQGIAGFGVPVAIVAPLMVGMGFSPLVSVTTTLIGHSWSVTFGSMASSFFTLRLVTSLPEQELAFWLSILFLVPILICGLSVSHIYQGWKGIKKGYPTILLVTAVMGFSLWFFTTLGAVQVGSVMAGLLGTITIIVFSIFKRKKRLAVKKESGEMDFKLAIFPYFILISTIIFFQIEPIREFLKGYKIAFSFPEVVTSLGYMVPAEEAYAAIRLFAHPAPFILLATIIGALKYKKMGYLHNKMIKNIRANTLKQCIPTTISMSFMVMMALIMNDSGMTTTVASGVASFTGSMYPIFAPFIGVLGSFMTGSNTNSNILFGAFQKQVALNLGVSTFIIAGAQSVGGSLGSAVAPAKALLGASTVGIVGSEGEIIKKTLSYCMLNVFILGVITWLMVNL